jgi:hypothetical protein
MAVLGWVEGADQKIESKIGLNTLDGCWVIRVFTADFHVIPLRRKRPTTAS